MLDRRLRRRHGRGARRDWLLPHANAGGVLRRTSWRKVSARGRPARHDAEDLVQDLPGPPPGRKVRHRGPRLATLEQAGSSPSPSPPASCGHAGEDRADAASVPSRPLPSRTAGTARPEVIVRTSCPSSARTMAAWPPCPRRGTRLVHRAAPAAPSTRPSTSRPAQPLRRPRSAAGGGHRRLGRRVAVTRTT